MDINTLREFLEWAGCGMYFKNAPFVTNKDVALINKIDESQLSKWVADFNELRQGSMSDGDTSKDPF